MRLCSAARSWSRPAPSSGRSFADPDRRASPKGANLPDTWSTTQNVTWKTAIPGNGWSSPIAWGDRIFVTSVIPVGEIEAPKRGLYLRRRAAGADRSNIAGWSTRSTSPPARSSGSAKRIAAFRQARGISRTPTRRRRRSPTASASMWRSATSASSPTISTASWCGRSRSSRGRRATAGARRRRRCCTTGASISSTTTKTASSLTALDAATRQDDLARRAAKETQLVDAVHLAARRAAPRSSPTARARCARTVSTARCCGSSGRCRRTSSRRRSRSSICSTSSSGYVGDPTSAGLCDQARRGSGDISLKPGETSNARSRGRCRRAAPTTSVADRLRRLLLHAVRSRVLHLPRREDRQGDLYEGAPRSRPPSGFTASPWAYNGKLFAMSEDGMTYVIQAGPEFKVIGQNVARRIHDGVTGDPSRQPADSNGDHAL